MFYDRIRKGWPFNTGDCLIGDLMAWACLTVYLIGDLMAWACLTVHLIGDLMAWASLTVHLIGDLMTWACLTVHEDDTNIYKIQT